MKKSSVLSVPFAAGFLAGMMVLIVSGCSVATHSREPAFRVLVVASSDPDHSAMIARAEPFLKGLAAENHFGLDFTKDAGRINEANLARYQVFIQLHLAPFNMSEPQQKALQKFIEDGHGWIGIHAAGLTGKQFLAPGTPYWQWFENLMGDIAYSPHPCDSTGFSLSGGSQSPCDQEPARVVRRPG